MNFGENGQALSWQDELLEKNPRKMDYSYDSCSPETKI
jgi:hypothetical protein